MARDRFKRPLGDPAGERPPARGRLGRIVVHQRPLRRAEALILAGALRLPAAIGAGGLAAIKREGDGAGPIGGFALGRLWLRPGRVRAGRCGLGRRIIRRDDLWCDAPGHRLYNRPARAPLAASHERMWREDHLYDAVVEIGWNVRPRVAGRGSAIFLHLAREDLSPTAGCVALRRRDLLKLLPLLGSRTRLVYSRGGLVNRPVRAGFRI
jgi:L,D-peptidoglycan transpeptidase YkuD (ErfK/YbiS/YcfS/YnhG family)